MTRMADGRMVPAQTTFNSQSRQTKLLIVIQYYEKDRAAAEELGTLIADLERIRNRTADVLIFARFDAPEFDRAIRTKLEAKFDKVHFLRCRRRDARSYPFAPNEMFYDLVTLLGQPTPWRDNYFAFVNLESDCVPLHSGWTTELIRDFRDAKAHGYSVVGHVHEPKNVPIHVNGVAVYDIDIWRIVGSGKLSGGNPNVAYDIAHAKDILPLARDTAYVYLDFQRPTIRAEDLFKPQKGSNVEPAIYHGVKDESARDAVRAKHVTFTQVDAAAQRTVFTYYAPTGAIGINESQSVLTLWKEGWSSRGWNPVVLSVRDAAGNGRYAALIERLKQIPGAKIDQFVRWLALDNMGGGFLVDIDVLPGRLTPTDMLKFDGANAFPGDGDTSLCAAKFSRAQVAKWADALLAYEVQPEDVTVTDRTVFDRTFNEQVDTFLMPLTANYGEGNWRSAPMIHFSATTLLKGGVRGERKSTAMERYLRGE